MGHILICKCESIAFKTPQYLEGLDVALLRNSGTVCRHDSWRGRLGGRAHDRPTDHQEPDVYGARADVASEYQGQTGGREPGQHSRGVRELRPVAGSGGARAIETEIVTHESGVSAEVAAKLVSIAERSRNLK